MNKILLVDVSNIYNKYYYANISNGSNYIDPALQGFCYFLTLLHNRILEYTKIHFVLDSDKQLHDKVKDYKGYKAGRETKKEVYKNWEDFLALLTLYHPNKCSIVRNLYRETDDVIAHLAKKYSVNKGNKIIIYSSDKDFCQLCSEDNISIADSFRKGEFITWSKHDIYNKFKDSTRKKDFTRISEDLNMLTIYRCFKGDKSDNISPAIPKLYDKELKEIVDVYDGKYLDQDKLAEIIIKLKNENLKHKIAGNFDNILHNFTLMSFDTPDRWSRLTKDTKVIKVKSDFSKLNSLLDKYSLHNYKDIICQK